MPDEPEVGEKPGYPISGLGLVAAGIGAFVLWLFVMMNFPT